MPLLLGAIGLLVALLVLLYATVGWRTAPDAQAAGILPFAGGAESDRALALGLGDHLRSELARRTDLRLVAIDRRDRPVNDREAADIGAALALGHVVGGEVRRAGDRVRVRTWLIDTGNGRRVWNDTVEGPVDDIAALQERIGARLASAMGSRLMPPTATRPTSGEVRTLYLAARGLLRRRHESSVGSAFDLLRTAEDLDPNYAPVQAALGVALILAAPTSDAGAVAAARAAALAHARRALELDPDLAEAHGALGMILGFQSPEAARYLRRAAELDPSNAEIQYWLGHVYGAELDFAGQLLAYRRAAELDPLWTRPVHTLIEVESAMGRFDRAEAIVRRFGNLADDYDALGARAFLAGYRADLSEAVRLWNEIGRHPRAGRLGGRPMAAYALESAGLFDEAARIPFQRGRLWSARAGRVPTAAELLRYVGPEMGNSDEALLLPLGIKRLLNAGGAGALAPQYDRPVGLLDISRRGPTTRERLVTGGALVGLVLLQAGRDAEAASLLRAAATEVDAMLRRGPVPGRILSESAQVHAALGRRDAAIVLLEQARGIGWLPLTENELHDIADEPAFASLRGDPRFERVRQQVLAHLARERAELLAMLRRGGA